MTESLGMLAWARLDRRLAVLAIGALEVGCLVTADAAAPTTPPTLALAATPARVAMGLLPRRSLMPAVEVTPSPSPTPSPTPAPPPRVVVAPGPPPPPPRPFPFLAGVNLLVYGNDPAFASKAATQLDRLARLHVNSVSFVFPIFQDGWSGTRVYADAAATPSTGNIRAFIRAAHARGIRVMVRPLMDEANLHPAGKWRGQIAPSSQAAWFTNYTSVVLEYARAAQAEGAELFDIGTEFDSLQGATQSWLNLITAVRGAYHGQITYSANWAIQYPAFGWAVDFISIDAFFPLAAPANATQQQLIAAWGRWVARANAIGYAWGKHVVFTELGTTSEVASFQTPWQWAHNSGLSLEAQRLYYAASCQALKGHISGMYWWELDLDPLAGAAQDAGYNPQGKPSENEIARCYA